MSKNQNLKIELNYAAVGELLRSEAVASYLTGVAGGVASAAGEEYDTMQGYDRVSVIVKPATRRAEQDNLDNNTLLKAVGEQEAQT